MNMPDIETLQAGIRILSARSTNMKMNLHDLAEELPIKWQTIMTVAQQTYDAFKALEAARAALKKARAKAA
jgi:hypothetical protein